MPKKLFYGLALVFICLALGLKFYKIMVSEADWDDGYYLNIATNYEVNGRLTPLMWRLDADTNIIAGSGTGYAIYLPNIWYSIFGTNLISGRILMYLVSLLMLPLIYLTSRLWWGHTAGLVAVVFTVLNPMFTNNSTLRMDAFGQLAYSLVLLLHIYATRSKRDYLHFFVGIAVVISAEFHILGILYLFGLAFYHSIEQILTIVSLRRFQLNGPTVYYMMGALIAGLAYIAIHILPDPEAYFIIARTCSNCAARSLQTEFIRIYELFHAAPIATIIFILAFYGLARHRHVPSHRHYLLLTLGTFLSVIVINPPAQFTYLSHLLPLWAIGVGGFFYGFIRKTDNLKNSSIIITSIFALLMLLPIRIELSGMPSGIIYPEEEVINYIQTNIPRDAVILGPPIAYVELVEYHNFISIGDGELYGITLRGETTDSYLEREAPQVIITRPYAKPDQYPESFAALVRYIEAHDFVEVMPGLLVLSELIND